MLESPDPDALRAVNDVAVDEYPQFAPIDVEYDQPELDDVAAATEAELADFDPLADLEPGAEVGITAGSRGIHDMPTILRTIVETLRSRGFEPFIFPAMGSHGGATAAGQRETLASLGITEETMGCEIRASMTVEPVSTTTDGWTVYAAADALAADAVLLVNRVKPHTDFSGDIESGLCKMAVVGLGKQRGAETMHKSALARSCEAAITERADALFEETPVIGGVAMLENARHRAAHVEAIAVDDLFDREPELQEQATELLPMLPVDDLDVLILDEIGKNVSGTGMDTNVVGRMRMIGEDEPATPEYRRIYVRSITEESHGNGIGIGLADVVRQTAIEGIDLTDTYVNALTSGEPSRVHLPLVAPSDELALELIVSATGVKEPSELRVARIRNTMAVDEALVSAPVAEELADEPNVTVGDLRPLSFDGETLVPLERERTRTATDD
jgi:hypothetical protein